MNILTFPDLEQLSRAAADYIVRVANEAIADHGRFTIALSGGSTPRKPYGLLALDPYRGQIDWKKVEIFWGDERCIPPEDAESNYHLAQEVMLSKLPIPTDHIHRMPADQADKNAAALAYEQELRRVIGQKSVNVKNSGKNAKDAMNRVPTSDKSHPNAGIPRFDLIHLGMGPEGHTASLFPHQASLQESERLVLPVSVPKPPPARLTFTPPVLNAAKHILFLVTGADKAEAVHAVLKGDYHPEEYPAQIVRPTHGEVTWMLDAAAASALKKS